MLFDTRGTAGSHGGGIVYLDNQKNTTSYRVSTTGTGVIELERWNGTSWN